MQPVAHPENQSDFYTEHHNCISCGAPEAEAPGLIKHSTLDEYGTCFFYKPVETEEEVYRAINAMMVSCIDAFRYGGKDPYILGRLHQLNMQHLCDHPLETAPQLAIQNRMRFHYPGSMADVLGKVIRLLNSNPYLNTLYEVRSATEIDFSLLFTHGHSEEKTLYFGRKIADFQFEIEVDFDQQVSDSTYLYQAISLHSLILTDAGFSAIQWFGKGDLSQHAYKTPF